METGNGEKKSAARQGVAIVGFIAIAIIGMAIAIYAARFVPSAISGLAGAGAFVSDIFVIDGAKESPTPEEETPAATPDEETPDEETPDEEAPVITPTPVKPTPTTPTYSGLPDLRADIVAMGYCTSRSQGSFVRSSSVPRNAPYAGAQFVLSNAGTNIAPAGWTFSVDTPRNERVESAGVRLLPGQGASGTTCFPYSSGENEVRVSIDSRGQIFESSESNNTDSDSIDASGGSTSSNNNDDLWCDITASDRTIDEGDSTTLEFDIEGADDARINNGVGQVDEDGGEERVRPREDTTYRLTVENDDGDTETCSVTIRVDEN